MSKRHKSLDFISCFQDALTEEGLNLLVNIEVFNVNNTTRRLEHTHEYIRPDNKTKEQIIGLFWAHFILCTPLDSDGFTYNLIGVDHKPDKYYQCVLTIVRNK